MMGNMSRFHIRPARPDETGLFYTPHPEEDRRRGTIGHVRMDFGRSGNEFWHTWWPRGPEELNSPVFKAELQEVVDTMRENVLKSRFSMERFCYEHGGKIAGGYVQNYGYIVETEHYRYCLRCNPSPGDYNGYLTAYDLDVQRQNMARGKALAFLKQQGLVDPAIFIAKTNELTKQLRQAKLEKEKLMDAESDMTALQTRDLIDILEGGPEFLDSFDTELFAELVEKIIIESNDSVRFCLKNGLELRESIERTVR